MKYFYKVKYEFEGEKFEIIVNVRELHTMLSCDEFSIIKVEECE